MSDSSSRIAAATAAIKGFHRSLAASNQAPFLHPRLYDGTLSTPIVDAFSSAVLYANRNPSTEMLVFRIMDKNVTSLIEIANNLTSRPDSPPRDILACVQAMLIYQTMRMFDGDIRQRANAESLMPLFKRWTAYLTNIRDSSDAMSNPSKMPESWDVSIPPTTRMSFLHQNDA